MDLMLKLAVTLLGPSWVSSALGYSGGALLIAAPKLLEFPNPKWGTACYIASVFCAAFGRVMQDASAKKSKEQQAAAEEEKSIAVGGSGGFVRLRLLFGMAIIAAAFAAVAVRADEPPTRRFGGCNGIGSFCYGPAASLQLVGMDLSSGKFTAGIIPGAGYGVTFFADKPYQLGLGGYAAIQTGPDTTSGMFSGVLSFAEYLRVGVARQIIGGDHHTLGLLGLGVDLK